VGSPGDKKRQKKKKAGLARGGREKRKKYSGMNAGVQGHQDNASAPQGQGESYLSCGLWAGRIGMVVLSGEKGGRTDAAR